ncbi:MAG: hypothetical protein ACRCV9_09775 [Burkholderiaceae bacterium]
MNHTVVITGKATANAKALIEGGNNAQEAKAFVEVLMRTDQFSDAVIRVVQRVGAGPAAQISARNKAHHLREGSTVTVKAFAVDRSKKRGVTLDITGSDVEIINTSLQAG